MLCYAHTFAVHRPRLNCGLQRVFRRHLRLDDASILLCGEPQRPLCVIHIQLHRLLGHRDVCVLTCCVPRPAMYSAPTSPFFQPCVVNRPLRVLRHHAPTPRPSVVCLFQCCSHNQSESGRKMRLSSTSVGSSRPGVPPNSGVAVSESAVLPTTIKRPPIEWAVDGDAGGCIHHSINSALPSLPLRFRTQALCYARTFAVTFSQFTVSAISALPPLPLCFRTQALCYARTFAVTFSQFTIDDIPTTSTLRPFVCACIHMLLPRCPACDVCGATPP